MSASVDRRLGILIAALFVSLFLPAGGSIAGQQEATSIVGIVTDESGGVLPGVTVTATSPSLQVTSMTTVTNERGEYRLTPLPIGTFAVEFSLSGFQTMRREGIVLTAAFVAKIDMALKVGSLQALGLVTEIPDRIRGTFVAQGRQGRRTKRWRNGSHMHS